MHGRKNAKRSIQQLLTSVFLLFSFLLLLVVTALISLMQYRYTRSETIDTLRQTCLSIANSVDQQINQMNQISLNAISAPDLEELLSSYLSDDVSANRHMQLRHRLDELLTGIKGFDFSVRQLNIYTASPGELSHHTPAKAAPASGQDSSDDLTDVSKADENAQDNTPAEEAADQAASFGYGLGEIYGDITVPARSMPWYDSAVSAGGRLVISLPETDEKTGTVPDSAHLSVCRLFFNTLRIPVGFVEVQKFYNTVFQLASSPEFSGVSSITVYDSTGRQLFPLPENTAGGAASPRFDYFSVFSDDGQAQLIRDSASGRQEYVCFSESEGNHLIVAAAAEHSFVTKQIYHSMIWIAVLFAVLFLLILLLSSAISRRISSPIRRIYHFLSDEKKEGFALLDLKDTGIREIDKLTVSINENIRSTKAAADTLIILREKEMQAQMLALQSQMNPHFLYNSLSTVGEMAEEGLTEPVSEMCRQITEIMRYISSSKEQRVPLEEELEICDMYIQCIRMRYGDQLVSKIKVPDEMLDVMIPKLCIQLLVENAIRSVTKTAPPWHVDVFCTTRDDRWYVTVRDNGSGFDPDTEAHLRSQMEQILEKGVLPGLQIQGMGLLNIFIRLYLLDGSPVIFEMGNNPERGAFVTIGGKINTAALQVRAFTAGTEKE